MAHDNEEHYTAEFIAMLEAVWGEGYLSPGGPDEVAAILAGHSVSGMDVLDIGCGTGGLDMELVLTHGAARVVGIDVEDGVLSRARVLVSESGLEDRIELVKTEPGTLPFADQTFDVVFSKDSIIHIPDKHALMTDVFRVLKPGGRFLASDWLTGVETVSPAMEDFIVGEGLGFRMATPACYRDALEKAGFTGIRVVSRNAWYRQRAREELALLEGAVGDRVADVLGRDYLRENIRGWERMISVLDTGELCPSHLHGTKPR